MRNFPSFADVGWSVAKAILPSYTLLCILCADTTGNGLTDRSAHAIAKTMFSSSRALHMRRINLKRTLVSHCHILIRGESNPNFHTNFSSMANCTTKIRNPIACSWAVLQEIASRGKVHRRLWLLLQRRTVSLLTLCSCKALFPCPLLPTITSTFHRLLPAPCFLSLCYLFF